MTSFNDFLHSKVQTCLQLFTEVVISFSNAMLVFSNLLELHNSIGFLSMSFSIDLPVHLSLQFSTSLTHPC
jgi:hypothetical protein